DAYVYHKRRTNLKKFFKQVFRFGAGRINIFKIFRDELKFTHFIPSAFVVYLIVALSEFLINFNIALILCGILFFYLFMIMIDSTIKNK
ncbi:MAG: glycosyl transferase family 2, partial [Flavobacteriales bacterium]